MPLTLLARLAPHALRVLLDADGLLGDEAADEGRRLGFDRRETEQPQLIAGTARSGRSRRRAGQARDRAPIGGPVHTHQRHQLLAHALVAARLARAQGLAQLLT